MLKKLLIILILISSIFFVSFADEKDNIINSLISQLAIANEKIVEQKEIIIDFQKSISGVLMVLENTTEALEKTSITLKESTEIIELQNDRIEKDQLEITNLRNHLQELAIGLKDYKYFGIGLAVTYPLGGQILAQFDIPRLPIGFFIDFGLNTPALNNIDIYFGGGIIFIF